MANTLRRKVFSRGMGLRTGHWESKKLSFVCCQALPRGVDSY